MRSKFPHQKCTAAHIVPYSFRPEQFKHFFGDAKNEMEDLSLGTMTTANGLYLYTPVEKAFDGGDLLITPHFLEDRNHFRVHVLNQSMLQLPIGDESPLLWKDIDHRKLEFLNSNRPVKRFIYFQALLTI